MITHIVRGLPLWAVGRDLIRASADSLEGTTLATVALVVVVLLLVYRAPLLALVPLATIGIAVWVAIKSLALLTLIPGVHLVNVSKIFAIVILYGAGTDYCLFLISRYREELENGKQGIEALAWAVGGVGEALAASAATVMIGLGLMALAEFAKVRYAVFGCGNSDWTATYQSIPRLIDERLTAHGARGVYARGEGDARGDLDSQFETWFASLAPAAVKADWIFTPDVRVRSDAEVAGGSLVSERGSAHLQMA